MDSYAFWAILRQIAPHALADELVLGQIYGFCASTYALTLT